MTKKSGISVCVLILGCLKSNSKAMMAIIMASSRDSFVGPAVQKTREGRKKSIVYTVFNEKGSKNFFRREKRKAEAQKVGRQHMI